MHLAVASQLLVQANLYYNEAAYNIQDVQQQQRQQYMITACTQSFHRRQGHGHFVRPSLCHLT